MFVTRSFQLVDKGESPKSKQVEGFLFASLKSVALVPDALYSAITLQH